MDPIRLIHIAPELPPTVGGLADYATILNQRLVDVSNGALEPVMVHAGKTPAETIEVDVPVADVSGSQSAAILANTIRELTDDTPGRTVVLLEYSGYGYAKRGAPLWLVRGLSRVCESDGVPLVTMFHEIRASSWKPWKSTFWMSPLQTFVATRLARSSQAVVTNRYPSFEWIQSVVAGSTEAHTQPVFSNIGEPDCIPEFTARDSYAVAFGGAAMKKRLYDSSDAIIQLLENAGIHRIVDLGRMQNPPSTVGNIPVEARGIQPASTISRHLRRASIGLLHYPVDYLTKSGIWASYAAHGLPAGIVSKAAASCLTEGKHFLRINAEEKSEYDSTKLAAIGMSARRWYQSTAHSKNAARIFEKLLCVA
jgi:hypothetical protein